MTRRVRVAALFAAAAMIAAACSREARITLPPPPSTVAPSTTVPLVDHSGANLPKVGGKTTTTIALQPGPASLKGTVVGPEGPVGGAAVRVERLVGDGVATVVLPTQPDGTWALPNVLGGRYRVRAWREPDLALTTPTIFFLEGSQTKELQLKLDRFAGLHAGAAIAPSPPVVGQPANLVVLVTNRSVDSEGVVRAVPVGNVRTELFGGGRWQLDTPAVTATDGSGQAQWQLRCRESGQQPLSVLVGDRESFPLNLPACADAPDETSTTTTARATSTTGRGSSTTRS